MNNDRLKELLDTIYELEGLVHLSLTRDDCSDDLCVLLEKKSEKIAGMCKVLREDMPQESTDSEMVEIAGEPGLEDDEFPPQESHEDEEYEGDDNDEEDDEYDDDEESYVLEDEEYAYEDEYEDEYEDSYKDEESYENEGKEYVEPPVEVEIEEKTKNEVSKEEEPKIPFMKIQKPQEQNPAPGKNTKGKLVFSINDKYRFRRDLFGNSDADFNNSLALVASMDSYEEAEDYFINELGMEPSRRSVMDFLEIINKYFN